uniref:Uncharacterized protein n=1 Tax=Cacopsylla melanoneura TaxID=428564 RepID=A0A8D8RGE2_9HEMI
MCSKTMFKGSLLQMYLTVYLSVFPFIFKFMVGLFIASFRPSFISIPSRNTYYLYLSETPICIRYYIFPKCMCLCPLYKGMQACRRRRIHVCSMQCLCTLMSGGVLRTISLKVYMTFWEYVHLHDSLTPLKYT